MHVGHLDHPFTVGTAIIVPPGMLYATTSEKGYTAISIGGEFGHFLMRPSSLVIQDNGEGDGMYLANMIYRNRHCDTHCLNDLINTYIHYLFTHAKDTNGINDVKPSIHTVIHAYAFEPGINMSMILKSAGLSTSYHRTKFTKEFGEPPTKYLARIRIEHACALIKMYKNAVSLTTISNRCGFTDYVYFSKKFKQLTGQSPRAYLKALMCFVLSFIDAFRMSTNFENHILQGGVYHG